MDGMTALSQLGRPRTAQVFVDGLLVKRLRILGLPTCWKFLTAQAAILFRDLSVALRLAARAATRPTQCLSEKQAVSTTPHCPATTEGSMRARQPLNRQSRHVVLPVDFRRAQSSHPGTDSTMSCKRCLRHSVSHSWMIPVPDKCLERFRMERFAVGHLSSEHTEQNGRCHICASSAASTSLGMFLRRPM